MYRRRSLEVPVQSISFWTASSALNDTEHVLWVCDYQTLALKQDVHCGRQN